VYCIFQYYSGNYKKDVMMERLDMGHKQKKKVEGY